MSTIEFPDGGYEFIPGVFQYSAGVRALPGHCIEGLFDGDESTRVRLDPARKAYVHLVKGQLNVNGQPLETGDALMVEGETELTMNRARDAEVLFFDLAA